MPELDGSKTVNCTAAEASGSLKAVVRSIERAGAPTNSVNAAIGVFTIGGTFCAEAVIPIARQKQVIRGRCRAIGDVLLSPRFNLGKSFACGSGPCKGGSGRRRDSSVCDRHGRLQINRSGSPCIFTY